ncbi:hypothetical protein [Desulfovibrio ferrophilus]|uniref:hypothetical protein n=1 Tax=Desulfovibrio ferrophilus TaxID=241368 RepID=UPI000F83E42D|nr:hypothetical protein [Desulfovibrio ferrophilus]
MFKILVVVFALVAVAGGVLAVAESSNCEGQVDVLSIAAVTRSGHFSHPSYKLEGSLDIRDCPSLTGCAPCGDEQSLRALKIWARKTFDTGDRPIVLKFR